MSKRFSKLQNVLLAASLLALPTLAALPVAQAAHGAPHAAVEPEFFRVSTSFQVTLKLTAMTTMGLSSMDFVEVKVPLGITLSGLPTPPANWQAPQEMDPEDGRRVFLFRPPAAPNVPAPAGDFVFPVASAACPDDFAAFAWGVNVDTANQDTALTPTQWCDKKAPRVHAALPAQTDTAAGTLTLVVADETAASIKSASVAVTYADGTSRTFTSTATAVAVEVDPTKAGKWTYVVTMEDKAGNAAQDPATGQPPRETFVVDVTAPTATLGAVGPQEAGKPTSITHSSADNSGVTWSTLHWRTSSADPWTAINVTGQAQTTSIVVNDHALVVQLYLNVTDPTGNGVEKFDNLTLTDTFAPTLSSVILPDAAEGAWRSSPPTKVTLDAADAGTPKARLSINWTIHTTSPAGAVTTQTGIGAPPLDLPALSAPGTHAIHWAGKDDRNNLNETLTRIVRIDPHAPTATLENVTSGWFTAPVWVTFKPVRGYSGLDHAGTKTFWTVDNATQAGWSALFSTDGVRWLNWTATSNASVAASGDGANQHLRVDTTAPTLSIQLSGEKPGADGLHAGNVTYALVANDPTSGVTLLTHALDGASPAAYAAPVKVTTDGVHTVVARARNAAGLETTQSATFTIDRAKPTLDILVNGSLTGAAFNHSAFVSVQTSDTTSVTLACSVNGVPFDAAAGVTVTTNGAHKAACNATDVAGNVANLTRDFTVDRSPPAILARGDLGYIRAFEGALTIQDVSNLQSVEGWLVAASGEGYAVTFTKHPSEDALWVPAAPAGLSDGRHTLNVRATDQFGRSSGWVEALGFHLLTVAPQAEVYVPGGYDKGFLAKAEVTWKILPHPAPAQMLVRIDGGAEAVGEQPLVIAKNGQTTVTFRTRDSAGNLGEPVTYTFVLDASAGGTTPPPPANRLPVVGGVSLGVQGGRVVATASGVGDPDGDPVQLSYRWRVNGADVTTATGSSIAATSGQRVQAFVTPWDGKAFGATAQSAVLEVPFENPPVARFGFTGQPRAGTPFPLDASASSGGVAPLHYSWSFSDGGSATGARVSHSFVYVGDGHAELTVTDARGATSKLRRDFQVAAQEIPREEFYSWRAPDGATHVLEGERAAGVTLLRELPGNALLLETPGGMTLWRPLAGTRDPVHGVGAAPGDARYADRTQIIPVSVPATAGWALATIPDPQPGLAPADLVDADGAAPTWWRDANGIHVLTRAQALELRYGLPELKIEGEARAVPGKPGEWTVVLTVTGGAPVQSLRLMDGERVLAEEAGRTLRVVHASPAAATLRGVVRTDDGQEAATTVAIPATPGGQQPPTTGGTPATPTTTEPPADDEDDKFLPAPGLGLVALALAGAALAFARRRRA